MDTESMSNEGPANGESHWVFVYGTLRRGGSNAFRMDGAGFVAAACVRGRLFRVDWYPALVLDAHGAWVTGEVFRVSGRHLQALDAYEGPEYRRVRVDVRRGDATTCRAWLWEWAGPVDGLPEIAGGDWLAGGE